jgi:hypothetical protein
VSARTALRSAANISRVPATSSNDHTDYSAPAIVPRGLRRALPSSLDAKVLACLAASANSLMLTTRAAHQPFNCLLHSL